MKILILEDDQERIKCFRDRFSEIKKDDLSLITYIENAQICIDMLSRNKFDFLFLDHDLDGRVYVSTDEENTGSEVARWIERNSDKLVSESGKKTRIIIHSYNEYGANYMLDKIEGSVWIPSVWEEPFFDEIKEELDNI